MQDFSDKKNRKKNDSVDKNSAYWICKKQEEADEEPKKEKIMMTIEEIDKGLKENGYIPNDDICYAVFEALSLQKPILIEGDPGVGKTSLAIAVSKMLSLPFLRLQMYDGLTKDEILYDYDYQRQLLTLEAVKPKINEEIKGMDVNAAIRKVAGDVNFYGEEFLIPRPYCRPLTGRERNCC